MKHKWAINSAFMAFYAFGCIMICWMLWGYKASFGDQMLPFVGPYILQDVADGVQLTLSGRPGPAVAMDYELKQSYLPSAGLYQNYPQSTMVYFQFVFCAITLILIAGSYLCRMNFFAWMLFVPLVSCTMICGKTNLFLMHKLVDDILLHCWSF